MVPFSLVGLHPICQLVLDIEPFASQSVRVTKSGRCYPDSAKMAFMAEVARQVSEQWQAPPLDIPIFLVLAWAFGAKRTALRDTAPDVDNLHKPLLDGMAKILYTVDSRIVGTCSLKMNVKGISKILVIPCVVRPHIQEIEKWFQDAKPRKSLK